MKGITNTSGIKLGKKTERNSNIELLRIVSMMFIVMGHFCDQGNLFDSAKGFNLFILYFEGMGARISVNIFLLIAVYYLVDAQYNTRRLLKLYLETFFYSSSLTLGVLLLGWEAPMKEILRGFLPFWGRALWFVSAYLTLCLMAPFLNEFSNLNKKKYTVLVIVSFGAVCGVSTLPDLQDAYLCDSLWFLFVYIWMIYIRKYILNSIKVKANVLLVCGIVLYLIFVILRFECMEYEFSFMGGIVKKITNQYLVDIKTMPNFLCALLIFFGVSRGKERHCKVINKCAKGTLAVYIVHQVPAFKDYLWYVICHAKDVAICKNSSLLVLGISLVIFFVVSIIDMIRIKTIEKYVFRCNLLKTLENKFDSLYIE